MKISEERLDQLAALCERPSALNPAPAAHRAIAVDVAELAELVRAYKKGAKS